MVTPPMTSTIFLKPSKLTSTKYLMSRPYSPPRIGLQAVVAGQIALARVEVGALADGRPIAVDLARVGRPEQAPGGPLRDRDVDRVARQAEHRDLLGQRVDRDDDERVGVERLVARPLVGADEQDVEPFLAVPRRDRHVRDGAADRRALGDGGVGRVGVVAAVVARGRGRDAVPWPGVGEASRSHSFVGSPTKMQPLSMTSLASMS